VNTSPTTEVTETVTDDGNASGAEKFVNDSFSCCASAELKLVTSINKVSSCRDASRHETSTATSVSTLRSMLSSVAFAATTLAITDTFTAVRSWSHVCTVSETDTTTVSTSVTVTEGGEEGSGDGNTDGDGTSPLTTSLDLDTTLASTEDGSASTTGTLTNVEFSRVASTTFNPETSIFSVNSREVVPLQETSTLTCSCTLMSMFNSEAFAPTAFTMTDVSTDACSCWQV